MIALKLAYRNLVGAGLRTFLNVLVLSFAFLLIIFYNGWIDGWNRQGIKDTKDWETGNGQFWVPGYDKYNPFTIEDSHKPLNDSIQRLIGEGVITPVLITQATIYPQGRMQAVLVKGIDPDQYILKLPSHLLKDGKEKYRAIIGNRMAKTTKLKKGDKVTMRWKDKNGSLDVREFEIADIFKCDVPSVDNGQIYVDINLLREMTGLENEATILVVNKDAKINKLEGWNFKSNDVLLADFEKLIKSKKGGGMVMQGLLLLIALLAIFDTQVLSIFRRQKEIGTYIALGMTRWQVVGIFTVEGAVYSIFAVILGAIYGIPLLYYLHKIGITLGTPDMGLTIAETIYPYFSLKLVISTIIFVVIAATIVSFLPARKISKLDPVKALKGKLQ